MMIDHLPGGTPEDTRFQFEIIRNLSESVRKIADEMSLIGRTQVSMLERLAVIEAGKVGARIDVLETKVDALFKDKDRRDGAFSLASAARVWLPSLFGLFISLYLLGRAMGLIPSPPTTITKIETPLAIERRHDAGNPPADAPVH